MADSREVIMVGRGPEMWRTASCCGGSSDDVVQLDLRGDGNTVGIVGLTAIFEQLYRAGFEPDAEVQEALLNLVAARNYVPRSARPLYATALLREYAAFCERKAQSGGGR